MEYEVSENVIYWLLCSW